MENKLVASWGQGMKEKREKWGREGGREVTGMSLTQIPEDRVCRKTELSDS